MFAVNFTLYFVMTISETGKKHKPLVWKSNHSLESVNLSKNTLIK